jgi:hypothetical protein
MWRLLSLFAVITVCAAKDTIFFELTMNHYNEMNSFMKSHIGSAGLWEYFNNNYHEVLFNKMEILKANVHIMHEYCAGMRETPPDDMIEIVGLGDCDTLTSIIYYMHIYRHVHYVYVFTEHLQDIYGSFYNSASSIKDDAIFRLFVQYVRMDTIIEIVRIEDALKKLVASIRASESKGYMSIKLANECDHFKRKNVLLSEKGYNMSTIQMYENLELCTVNVDEILKLISDLME